VKDLSRDFEERGDEWENITVPDYLEAISAWVTDMDGVYINEGEPVPTNVPWRFFARVLLAGTDYE
jgi:hypothetical protein